MAFMATDMPESFIKRPREFEQLIAQLLGPKRENAIAITTALQGAGGYGKTTLAIALCHDDRVIDAFDDGILWVTLGQYPNVLAELTRLHKALTGDQPAFVDEKDAELKLREKLENRNCLLVIDDVWKKSHLEPFLEGGKRTCARLITTRRSDIVMDAEHIQVDEMAPEEAAALLATHVPLGKAGRDDARRALLVDFDWMMAKLKGTDIQSLIADYDYLDKEADLRLIQSALRLSAHVLVRDSRQLAGQLVGRLLGNNAPAIQALLKKTSENEALAWLRPLKRSLTAPGGPLIRTLEGHMDGILDLGTTQTLARSKVTSVPSGPWR